MGSIKDSQTRASRVYTKLWAIRPMALNSKELAKELNMGTTPASGALHLLRKQGLIKRQEGAGYNRKHYVLADADETPKAWRKGHTPQVSGDTLGKLTALTHEVKELRQFKAEVEALLNKL